MTAKVIGVATDSNEDGSHSILIEHEGKQVPVVIPIQHLQDLIGQFQVSAIHKAHESVESIRIPELSVTRIDIAHKGPSCELMVSTTQTGTVDRSQLTGASLSGSGFRVITPPRG
jgi:CBS-domain-containing membrane protein